MPIEFPPQNGVRFIKNIMIPMSEGTKLAMDMHIPDSADWQKNPLPVILEYIPYRKDDVHPYTGYHNRFAENGFIGARLDCRGTGSSEGTNVDEYEVREQQDCYEAIEWIAKQPWSTGKIAMFGASYGGFTAVQLAALAPPHLTTIVPMVFTDDRYTDDCHYRGGVFRCYYDTAFYGSMMVGMNAMPPYPEYSGDRWAEIWEQHLRDNAPYTLTWLKHQLDGEYWRPGSLTGRFDKVKCSAFLIGAWRDGYPNPPMRTFRNIKSPKKVLIGPWNHSRPNIAIPGPQIDYLHEVMKWCAYWLKGEKNGVMDEPPITYYMQTYDRPDADRHDTTGYWRAEYDAPVEGAQLMKLFLREDGRLDGAAPKGKGQKDVYEYRPTVGITGGLWSGGIPFGLPTDQRTDEAYSVNFTSEPLAEPMEIQGQPVARIHVSSTAPVMAFVVRLTDVAPDGTSALICNGILNGTRRKSMTSPEPMKPGEVYELQIDLDDTAWRFPAGHRIRVSVCSADYPNHWPTPYKGVNTLYRDAARPSSITLPVIPLSSAEEPRNAAVKFAHTPTPTPVFSGPPDVVPWEIVTDLLNDRSGLRLDFTFKARAGKSMEVTTQNKFESWASNRDPSDVVVTGKHLRKIARLDGVTTVDTCCTIRSTETAFHVTVDLEIEVNGLPHFQKRWVESFKRELM